MSFGIPGGSSFLLAIIILSSCIWATQSSYCPLLNSYENNTGILYLNRTMISTTDFLIHCQWLIVGSSDQRIVVEFDYVFIPIPTDEYLHQGCRRGSITLWTPGLEHEKIEICGDRKYMRIGGVGQTLMIDLKLQDVQLNVQFLMRYQLVQLEKPLTVPPSVINAAHSPSQMFSECGRTSLGHFRVFNQSIFSRIVGGQQAVPHSHPWQVLLSDRGRFCGAAILNENWIITAAHCVNGTETKNLLAEFGVHDRYNIESSRLSRTIAQIIVYPSYNGKSSRWRHDIALLRLSSPLQFNPFIRSICLPSKDTLLQFGDRTLVTGWGETQGTGNFRYLREVEVPIQSYERCGLNEVSWSTSLCAGLCSNGTCDACQGDSGGPMIVKKSHRWHLVGLISWGFSCSGLGVYTKVSYYIDWIQQWISQ